VSNGLRATWGLRILSGSLSRRNSPWPGCWRSNSERSLGSSCTWELERIGRSNRAGSHFDVSQTRRSLYPSKKTRIQLVWSRVDTISGALVRCRTKGATESNPISYSISAFNNCQLIVIVLILIRFEKFYWKNWSYLSLCKTVGFIFCCLELIVLFISGLFCFVFEKTSATIYKNWGSP